jgi:hypothetical protein
MYRADQGEISPALATQSVTQSVYAVLVTVGPFNDLTRGTGLRASYSSTGEERRMAMRPRICFAVLFLSSYQVLSVGVR